MSELITALYLAATYLLAIPILRSFVRREWNNKEWGNELPPLALLVVPLYMTSPLWIPFALIWYMLSSGRK